MLRGLVDKYANEYIMMTNAEKRVVFNEIKKREERTANFFWYVFLVMLILAGSGGWLGFFVFEMSHSLGGDIVVVMTMLFAIGLFVLVSISRSSENVIWLWAVMITVVIGIEPTSGSVLFALPWLPFFVIAETKMIAMKKQPGYPAFQEKTQTAQYNMTEEQYTAYMKKQLEDMNDPEQARRRDSENLDKILEGKMNLDQFFGVDREKGFMNEAVRAKDMSRLAKSDKKNEKKELSAEDFFKRFETRGGSINEKTTSDGGSIHMKAAIDTNNGGSND